MSGGRIWGTTCKMDIQKIRNAWDNFGFVMMCSKAWEKFVVDAYRFRANCHRKIPSFPDNSCMQELELEEPLTTKKICICYLLHYFFPDKQGGTERFVLNQAIEQKNRGNRVHIITLGKRPENQYLYDEGNLLWTEFLYEGILVTQIRYRRAPRGLYYDAILPYDPGMTEFANMAIERYRPDVVHMAYPQPFAAFAKVCKKKGVPYIVTLTDFNIFCHYATMVSKSGEFCPGSLNGKRCKRLCGTYGVEDAERRYLYAKELIAEAAEIAVPSQFIANVINAEFPNYAITVIPHGIYSPTSPVKPRIETKAFLYAGTLSSFKGVHFLIQAFRMLQGDVTLKVCGTGENNYIKNLHRLADGDRRITFCGSIAPDKMLEVYQQADCVVVPSIWFETYNFVLREALACGCLGIASDLGAMPEVIQEGENGFCFDAGNKQSLLNALQKARQFNWSKYRQNAFPSIVEECTRYRILYQKAEKVFES